MHCDEKLKKILIYVFSSIAIGIWYNVIFPSYVSKRENLIMFCILLFNILRIIMSKKRIRIETILHLAIHVLVVPLYFRQFQNITIIYWIIVSAMCSSMKLNNRRIFSIMLIGVVIVSEVSAYEINLSSSDNQECSLEHIQEQMTELQKMSVSERLYLAQKIVDFECSTLGIKGVPIRTEVLDSEIAYFKWGKNYTDREIVIDKNYLSSSLSPDELINTIAHEVYHCLQWEETKIYENALKENAEWGELAIFSTVKQYRYEAMNYVSGKVDRRKYEQQLLEVNAREHARLREEWYKKMQK